MIRRVSVGMVALWGCSAQPTVTGISPERVAPGESLAIIGSALAPPAFVALKQDGQVVEVLDGVIRTSSGLAVRLPDDFVPGAYDVEVALGERVLPSGRTITVIDPPAESACRSGEQYNTSVALTHGTIGIDRFDGAGNRTRLDVETAHVLGVEYEVAELGTEEPCTVIWLRLDSGRRVPFDVRTGEALEGRARRLAEDLGRPLSVTRQDEPAAADADEPG